MKYSTEQATTHCKSRSNPVRSITSMLFEILTHDPLVHDLIRTVAQSVGEHDTNEDMDYDVATIEAQA